MGYRYVVCRYFCIVGYPNRRPSPRSRCAKGAADGDMTGKETLERLLQSLRTYYNIETPEPKQDYLIARCDYFERNEKYVLSRKANLWSAEGEEFLYLFDVPHLTREIYEQCRQWACEDGMGRLNIRPDHMCSYITALVICDSCEDAALAALKKSRFHKSFHFSLRGWMDYRAALVCAGDDRVEANAAGRSTAKFLKKVLYNSKKKGEK